MAFCHRGLCQTETIEADYSTYRKIGRDWLASFGEDCEPDFFIKQRDRWWKLDDQGEIFAVEFCAADYTEED